MIREVKLGEILEYEQPSMYIVKNTNYDKTFDTPVLTAGQSFILGYTNEKENIFKAKENPVIIFDDFTTASKYVDFDFKVKSSAMKILKPKEGINIKYIYYAMKNIKFDNQLHKRYWISEYSKIKLLLPDIKIQEKIVKELDLINKLLDYKKKQIELFDDFIKSQFVEMFGDKNYLKIRLKEVLVQNQDVEKIENTRKEKFVTVGINGKGARERIIKDEKWPVPFVGYRVKGGQFIYSRIDARNGAFAIIPNSLNNAVVSKDFPIFDIDYNKIKPDILLFSLLEESFIDIIKNSSFGATNRQRIKEGTFLNYKIYLPPLHIQNQFSEIVKQIDKQKFESMIQLKMMEKIYNIINDRRRYV